MKSKMEKFKLQWKLLLRKYFKAEGLQERLNEIKEEVKPGQRVSQTNYSKIARNEPWKSLKNLIQNLKNPMGKALSLILAMIKFQWITRKWRSQAYTTKLLSEQRPKG